jgi:hypothetical protein
MKHNFCYKLIGILPDDLLSDLKEVVLRSTCIITPDFNKEVIRVKHFSKEEATAEDILVISKFYKHMGKYFNISGHMGTNVARMTPVSYINEHNDYGAKTFGSQQDTIIKLQIPIITTEKVGMMWAGDKTYPPTAVHMVEGGIYIIDNVKVHSVVNLESAYRYNLTSRWHIDSIIDPTLLE